MGDRKTEAMILSGDQKPEQKQGGFLLLGSSRIEWTQSAGVAAHQATYEIDLDAARAAADMLGSTVTLKLISHSPSWGDLAVSGLQLLQILSSGRRNTRLVLVADRRVWWPRKHIVRSYNIRRQTGNKRVVRQDDLQNVETVDTVHYAAWSLNPPNTGKPWTASEILADVMAELDPDAEVEIPTFRDKVPVENLELDDSGDQALARVLDNLPGIGVYVGNTGAVVFYDQLNQSEGIQAGKGFAVVDRGWPVMVSNQMLRPAWIDVVFDREIELRMDSVEGTALSGGLPCLQNVIPVTDQVPVVIPADPPNTVVPRTVCAGTWLTVNEMLNVWRAGVPPLPPAVDPNDLINEVRKLWLDGLFRVFQKFTRPIPDPVWLARIAAFKAHYRQTYRIDPFYLDRFYSIAAVRASVVDPASGTRQPAQAWSDYTIVPSERAKKLDGWGDCFLGASVRGYAQRLDNGHACPITVKILNEQQGIIRLDFQIDPNGSFVETLPSYVENQPNADVSGKRAPRWFGEAQRNPDMDTVLSPNHGVAVVMTVAPSYPSASRRLKSLRVTPTESQDLLKSQVGVNAQLVPASGPPLTIRVNSGILTARYAWWDTDAYYIKLSNFLLFPDKEMPEDAWQNENECKAVANAVAAVAYAHLVDRLQGSRVTAAAGSIHLTGSLDSVTYSLDPGGEATTALSLPLSPQARRNFFSLLPDGIRARILHRVQA